MNKTIFVNGKTLDEIEEALREPFPEDAFKRRDDNSNDLYLPIEQYEKRLNDVVGITNYDKLVSDLQCAEIAGRQVFFVTATIRIYDDERNIVLTKSAVGGSNVAVGKDSGMALSLKQNVSSADSEAFKNCCKALSIGMEQTRKHNASGKWGSQKNGNNAEALHHVRLLDNFSGNEKAHSVKVKDLKSGEELKLVIFQNQESSITKYVPMDEFFRLYVKGKELTLYGRTNMYRSEKQLIFLRPQLKGASA